MKRTPPVITVEGLDTPEEQEAVVVAALDVWAERRVAERREKQEATA